jgi:hypothetical protein
MMTVFDAESGMCSGSESFQVYADKIGYCGTETIQVRTATADELVRKYGVPNFIKIDVEGMDDEVLKALTTAPAALSFEYHTDKAMWTITSECFAQVRRLGFRFANLTEFAGSRFYFNDWVSVEAAFRKVNEWRARGGCRWGDVVVRYD